MEDNYEPFFSSMSPLSGETRFLFVKIWFLGKYLESPLIFILFFKKEKQNKKEKTLSVTPEKKCGSMKTKSDLGFKLPIEKV